MLCDFVKEINKLRRSSIEAVDDENSFENVKRYLHVERLVEIELKNLLAKINVGTKKTLVLLCGSTGDGKSHLISYLKNVDDKRLLDNFAIHNDAAESDRKDRTAIQTLSTVLQDFRDDSLEQSGNNLILAINLGILSNFIESEEGKPFTKLASYVNDKYILAGQISNNCYDPNSNFQYISFGDYNIYSLTEDGIKTDYLSKLISKICASIEGNPFYKIYCNKNTCALCKKCPVRHNFELLSNPIVQSNIAKIITEVAIKDKNVISTREVLDFIYDILVHHDFDYTDLCTKEVTESIYMDIYIQYSLPMLIYEYSDRSSFINSIIKYDVLKERSEALDEYAVSFSVSDDIKSVIKKAVNSTPYKTVLLSDNLNKIVYGNKKSFKSNLFRFITRLRRLIDFQSFSSDMIYQDYVRNLYWYNKGEKPYLSGLYQMVTQCVFEWNGKLNEDYICINNYYDEIAIFEKLNIEPCLDQIQCSHEKELNKFTPYITTCFKKQGVDSDIISLDIDYSLFKLLYDIKNGYKPSAEDKNRHADFIAFINSLILLGNAQKEIMLIDNRRADSKKGVFKKTAFGYEFKVI